MPSTTNPSTIIGIANFLPSQRLGELVGMRKSIEPGSEAYQTEGIPFVRVADLNKFGIETPSICLDKATLQPLTHKRIQSYSPKMVV